MKNAPLRQLLQELHQEIAELETLDTTSQAKIEAIFERVEAQANQGETDTALPGQLQETIIHFEVTHPTLTRVLNQIASMLSSMGI